MQEKEVKIIEINKNDIITKLKLLGAKKEFEGMLKATYFDSPGLKGKILRLRKTGRDYELTYKKKISKNKIKRYEEVNIDIPNGEVLKKILLLIGLKIKVEYTKKRISYSIGKVKFDLDKYKKIPWIMEIEAPSVKQIYHYADLLGFSKKELLPWSGSDLRKHYEIKKFS